jgi:hypothetical protein
MLRFLSLSLIVSAVFCMSQTAFAQETLVAWRGTHSFKNGTKREYDYIFDKKHGTIVQQSMEGGKVTGYASGEYAFQNGVLTIHWTESNQIEEGRLENAGNKILYKITIHTGDATQVGTQCTFVPYQLHPIQAKQIGLLSQMERQLIEQRKALNLMTDQRFLQLQSEMNMLPYKYSNAFGKALGQPVIE